MRFYCLDDVSSSLQGLWAVLFRSLPFLILQFQLDAAFWLESRQLNVASATEESLGKKVQLEFW